LVCKPYNGKKVVRRKELIVESKRAMAIIVILISLAVIVVAGYKLGASYIEERRKNERQAYRSD